MSKYKRIKDKKYYIPAHTTLFTNEEEKYKWNLRLKTINPWMWDSHLVELKEEAINHMVSMR